MKRIKRIDRRSYIGDEIMIKLLSELPIGKESTYLLNCGTQRITLNKIDMARVALRVRDRDAKFIFGTTIKNGQNEFVGMTIKRIA